MTCAMCARSITMVLTKSKGIYKADVNLVQESVDVIYNPNFITLDDMADKINNIGFTYIGLKEFNKENPKIQKIRQNSLNNKRNRVIVGFLFSIPLMILMFGNVMLPIPMSYFMLIITIIPFIYVAGPIFKSSFNAIKIHNLNMDVMYALGIGVAYISSILGTFHIILTPDFLFYETSLMLGAFLMLGKWLEEKAKGNTSKAIDKLMNLQVKTATLEKTINGKTITQTEKIENIISGNIIIVKPGEHIPLDGIVIEGKSHVNESFITGESTSVLKKPEDKIVGGSINEDGMLKFKVTHTGNKTILSQIIQLVQDAQNSHPPIQRKADKIVTIFIPTLLTIAFISFIIWNFIFHSTLLFSLTILISVLVVACPCSLGLATPTAVTVGIGRAAEFGILIKNGETLEISKDIDTVLLDKTGTITEGQLTITDIINYGLITDEKLLKIATSIEQYSQHPISTAITDYSNKKNITLEKIEDFKIHEGKGISGKINDKRVYIGNEKILKTTMPDNIKKDYTKLQKEMKTTLLIIEDNTIQGLIAVTDDIKKSSKKAIKKFKEMGLNVAMITGDNKLTAEHIAQKINIDTVISEVLPQDKSHKVKQLQEKGHKVAFIGDGINDAPALAQSNVGIAIGGKTDIAMEAGDIILVNGDLTDSIGAIQLSNKVMTRIYQNLFWAFAYNIILIPIAAGILIQWNILFKPEYSAFAMALSSVTVVTLSLLLKTYTPQIYKKED